jgi:hypothetical protein
MADDAVTRGDLEALRSELKDEIATTRLEVSQLRTEGKCQGCGTTQ